MCSHLFPQSDHGSPGSSEGVRRGTMEGSNEGIMQGIGHSDRDFGPDSLRATLIAATVEVLASGGDPRLAQTRTSLRSA
jgi:hypothetical protein